MVLAMECGRIEFGRGKKRGDGRLSMNSGRVDAERKY